MRRCGDNRTIGNAIADEALLQQQEFPDLAGSPAIFLVCLTPAAIDAQSHRRQWRWATSLSRQARRRRSNGRPIPPTSRTAASSDLVFEMPKK